MIRDKDEGGFSVLEMVLVVTIGLILAGYAIPKFMTALRNVRLHGTGTDFSGVVQTARWRAVQDDRFYSIYFLLPPGGGSATATYVDIYPQNINGASGNGPGGPADPRDPLMPINSEISERPQASAPNTLNLQGQILPAGSPVVPLDGGNLATPISFGPRGLPCFPTATNGGTVCTGAGGARAYWVFFQNNITLKWEAVTVTPAGRIQTWYYGASWTPIGN